jgi:hypothetical protein
MNYKRLLYSVILGAISGILCASGAFVLLNTEPSIPNISIYLIGAFYNRIIIGFLIGFAEELKIYKEKDNMINSIIRGLLLGLIVSIGFAFFNVYINLPFFFMGMVFGILIDLIATKLSK